MCTVVKQVNKTQYALVILCIVFMHACSSRGLYEAIQNYQKVECRKVPQSEYDECMERVSESYDVYTQSREEATEKK